MDARKTPLGPKEAIKLARSVDELYVAKGKRVMHVNVKKEQPSDKELEALLIGPTGNLRAPTFRIGRTLVVGFEEATYQNLFK